MPVGFPCAEQITTFPAPAGSAPARNSIVPLSTAREPAAAHRTLNGAGVAWLGNPTGTKYAEAMVAKTGFLVFRVTLSSLANHSTHPWAFSFLTTYAAATREPNSHGVGPDVDTSAAFAGSTFGLRP
jgi:hypothetical protein